MFCSECGASVSDDAKFCGECGAVQTTAGLETTTTASNKMQSCPCCNIKGWEHGKRCGNCGYIEGREVASRNKLQASVTTTPSSSNSNVAGYIVGAIMLVGLGYIAVDKLGSNKTETVQSNQVESGDKNAWLESFKKKTWQEMQGLSCGMNRFHLQGDQLVTTQGNRESLAHYQMDNIDNIDKSFVLTMTRYFNDGPLVRMFPMYANEISGKQTYTFKMLSEHKIKLVRRILMMDMQSMLKGNQLSYLPEETDVHIIFDCE